MNDIHTVVHDRAGLAEGDLPPDRPTHERLVRAVLSWQDTAPLHPADYEQMGLLLSGAAHVVAAELRHRVDQLGKDDRRGHISRIVLSEAESRLSQPSRGTLHGVQHQARLIQALYQRLDHLAPGRTRADGNGGRRF
ncbi:restriction endonuclease [Streptomyces sp. NPDC001941]|uniref:restriction endonuclease n=1 Tax=Streptomyces sp. NPDC001941 TaxID=3154659 RepID=UPI0033172FE5